MATSRGALDGSRSGSGRPASGQRRRLRLAGLPKPVARSRAFTGEALADWSWLRPEDGVDPDVVDDVVLLVAELVANAMMHGGGPLELVLDATEARLRIEVSDGSSTLPELRLPHRPGVPGGHGLFIVQRAA
ncbi:ATP-binding protein, partial [Kitasatospora sp. NPDC001574]